jgi:hypothetical protein
METAAAILTKIAFDSSEQLRAKLQAINIANDPEGLTAVILPMYRQISGQLRKEHLQGR